MQGIFAQNIKIIPTKSASYSNYCQPIHMSSRGFGCKKILFPAWFSRQEKGCCVLPKKLLAIMKISTTQGKKCSFLRGNPRTTLPSSDNIFLSYDLSNPFCRQNPEAIQFTTFYLQFTGNLAKRNIFINKSN